MQNLLAGPLWRRDAARIYTEAGGSKKDKGKKKERQKTGKNTWASFYFLKQIVLPTGESWDRGRLPNKNKAIEKS